MSCYVSPPCTGSPPSRKGDSGKGAGYTGLSRANDIIESCRDVIWEERKDAAGEEECGGEGDGLQDLFGETGGCGGCRVHRVAEQHGYPCRSADRLRGGIFSTT